MGTHDWNAFLPPAEVIDLNRGRPLVWVEGNEQRMKSAVGKYGYKVVKLEKGDFIGRDALRARHAAGEKERFVPLIVEGNTADAPSCSIVFKDGKKVGIVGSGGWGFRIGKSIALSYVRLDLAEVGTKLEVEILGTRFPAVVAEEPIFDPKNERLKA